MKIPFYSNTEDGTHCLQACLKMAFGVFFPNREFSFDELDVISQKLPDNWTWPTAAMLWMLQNGLHVKLIEEFDYHAFAEHGVKYLRKRFGNEVAKVQGENTDIPREQGIARQFAAIAPIEYRVPTLDDIALCISRGAIVMVNINSALLYGQEGYSGHFVIVCDLDDKYITIHDPGLPPGPNLKIARDIFERSWSYPTQRDKNLMAVSSQPVL